MDEHNTKIMRAAQLSRPGCDGYELNAVPIPSPGPYDLLLKVRAAGFCHTDTIVPLGVFGDKFPITGSHEPAGVVVAMGSEAEKQGWKAGERAMAMLTFHACGACPECKYHHARYCPKASLLGLRGQDGAFAEYCLVDSRMTARIPDALSFEQAAPLTCAGVTAFAAVERANLSPGSILAISGLGAVGYLAVQFAKAKGLTVVGIDARRPPIDSASRLPEHLRPDLLVDASTTSAEEALEQIHKLRSEGYDGVIGADALISLTDAPSALAYSCAILAPHALLILTAAPLAPTFALPDFIFRDLRVVGTLNGTVEDLQRCAQLCVDRAITSDVQCVPFGDEGGMREVWHGREREGKKGKVVVVF